jgi:Domain of unknown function (DUF4167)
MEPLSSNSRQNATDYPEFPPSRSENVLDQARRRSFRPNRPQNAPRPSRTRQGGARHGNPRQAGGNARSKYESYVAMARDAASRGDTIEAENFYQHAEHYFRVLRGRE